MSNFLRELFKLQGTLLKNSTYGYIGLSIATILPLILPLRWSLSKPLMKDTSPHWKGESWIQCCGKFRSFITRACCDLDELSSTYCELYKLWKSKWRQDKKNRDVSLIVGDQVFLLKYWPLISLLNKAQ